MKALAILPLAALLGAAMAGCGPDVMTSAASSAQAAAAQAQAAKQEKEIMDQKIKAMQDAQQQHQRNLGEQIDHPDHADKGSQ